MARAALTVQSLTDAGLNTDGKYTTMTAEGVSFANQTGFSKVILHIKATTAAQITIQTYQTINGLAVADRIVSIGAGEDMFIGPFPTSLYNQLDGTVLVDSDQLDTQILAFSISTNS
jgi:hypothetical protein